MDEPVRFESDGAIGTVTIDAPDARNTLVPAVVEGIDDTLDDLDGVQCLVIQGAGETFCAGGDLDGIVRQATGDLSARALLDRFERIDALIEQLVTFPAPTVAAVDGPAFGAGGSLALACDLRVASAAGSIGFGFHRLGLPPGAGASLLVPRLVGRGTARRLLFSGALLDAERARTRGLFDRVVPTEQFQRGLGEFVADITDADPTVTGETKRLLGPDRTELRAAMVAERNARARILETKPHRERVRTFLNEPASIRREK